MKSSFCVVLCSLIPANALANIDQGALFGTILPPETFSFAVKQDDGTLAVYAAHGNEVWPHPAEGERWPEYIDRVNIQQSMPFGVWIPMETVPDARLDSLVASVNSKSEFIFRHYVSWGYFDNGTSIVRAVVLLDERMALYPHLDSPIPAEDITTRVLWVIAYPPSDAIASEMMHLRILPYEVSEDVEDALTPASDLIVYEEFDEEQDVYVVESESMACFTFRVTRVVQGGTGAYCALICQGCGLAPIPLNPFCWGCGGCTTVITLFVTECFWGDWLSDAMS